MIFSTLFAGALALPLAVQASHGGTNNNHRRHHADLAARVVNTNTTAEVNTLEKRAQFSNARFTYYDITTGQVACEGYYQASDFVVALNIAQYGTYWKSQYCFNTITISFGGKTTSAQIVDECPGCPYGGLDMTQGLFEYFSDVSAGVITGEWSFGGSSGSGGGGDDTPTTTSTKAQPTPTPTPTPTPEPAPEPTPTPTPTPEPTSTTHKETPTTTSTQPTSSAAAPTTSSTSVKPSSSAAPSSVAHTSSAAPSHVLTGPGAALALAPAAVVTVDASNPQTLNAVNWAFYGLGSLILQA